MFYPAEHLVAVVIASLFVTDMVLVVVSGSAVDWAGYASAVLIGTAIMAVGLIYRMSRRDANIALAAVAAGLFILFTIVGSAFNYLLLPVGERRIDEVLIRLDSYLGYSWPEVVSALAQFPVLGAVLRWVYMSSLPQFIVVIGVLGFTGRRERLHCFLLTGIIAALSAIAIWYSIPSSGPAAFFDIPAHTETRLGMVVGMSYGQELNRLVLAGPELISPKDALGLIAFPSFHTVMALMAVYSIWPIRQLVPLFLLINVMMIPAILVHGGHHLLDILAGLPVFAFSLAAAWMILSRLNRMPDRARRAAAPASDMQLP